MDQNLIATQADSLTAIRGSVNDDALITEPIFCLDDLLLWLSSGHLVILQSLYHVREFVEASFLVQCLKLCKVLWEKEARRAHEVEDIPEEMSVPVYEVVLLEAVQDDGDRTIEQLPEFGLRIVCQRLQR